MADSPPCAEKRCAHTASLVADQRRDRGKMIRLERMTHPEKGSETRTRQKLDQWHNVGGIDIVRESSCCNVSLRCPRISYIVWAVFLKS